MVELTKTEVVEGINIIYLSGQMVGGEDIMRAAMLGHAKDSDMFIFDLSEVTSINSGGRGSLLRAHHYAESKGFKMDLCGIPDEATKPHIQYQIRNILSYSDSLDETLLSFGIVRETYQIEVNIPTDVRSDLRKRFLRDEDFWQGPRRWKQNDNPDPFYGPNGVQARVWVDNPGPEEKDYTQTYIQLTGNDGNREEIDDLVERIKEEYGDWEPTTKVTPLKVLLGGKS